MRQLVFITNHFLHVPAATTPVAASAEHTIALATVLANMAYYGYAPAMETLTALRNLNSDELGDFWLNAEADFKEISGDNRDMAKFVVYKNFPAEVLDMSAAHYWFNQICMYLGAPTAWFTQEPAQRPPLNEDLKLKTLALVAPDTGTALLDVLVNSTARWNTVQLDQALWLYRTFSVDHSIDVDAFGFKENAIRLIAATINEDGDVAISNATDVLRLAAALSGGDVSLRTATPFRAFNSSERRLLVELLHTSKNLLDDMALRPGHWKKLLRGLHPGDFKQFTNVTTAYHALYRGEYRTFNREVDALRRQKDPRMLNKLATRPGEYTRRLHSLYALFGQAAIVQFVPLLPKLETTQLLKLQKYAATINARKTLIYPPRGNWAKAQFSENAKVPLSQDALDVLIPAINAVLAERGAQQYPAGVTLDPEVSTLKLQTNDQELAPYGRGSTFSLPDEITFVRTASYWQHRGDHNVWFDNGWNFFDDNWNYLSSCCWCSTTPFGNGAAIFSGDPVNAQELEGRACQLIDLNLTELAQHGVRYAVWNVLCYSHVPFSGAEDVLATLQWGVDPAAGSLYEPARAQMVFPLKGQNLTKYVAYLDIVERKLVYMDANLSGSVSSAGDNGTRLQSRMPAFVEYLASLPGVVDYFANVPMGPQVITAAMCLNGTAFEPQNVEQLAA